LTIYTNKHKIPFQIDEEDYKEVSLYSWYFNCRYLKTMIRDENGKDGRRSMMLHELLMGQPPEGFVWDHINRDTLDNHKENLELITYSVSCRNRGIMGHNTSGYTGVRKTKNGRFWAGIKIAPYKHLGLGTYDTFEEAVAVRRAAELKYWGQIYSGKD